MEGSDIGGAVLTVLLVAAGVILATVVMNQFEELFPTVAGRG